MDGGRWRERGEWSDVDGATWMEPRGWRRALDGGTWMEGGGRKVDGGTWMKVHG